MTSPPAERSNALSLILGVTFVFGLLGAAYSMLFYAGPYRWLAEAQLRWFDAYYASVTIALTLALFIVPPLVTARILTVAGRIAPDSLLAALVAPNASANLRARMAHARFWLILFGVGLTLVVLSARDLLVAARGKRLEQVAVSALERGVQPAGTWLELQGTPIWDAALNTEERHQRWTFIPVVSTQWKPGAQIRALLRVRSEDLEQIDAKALRGTLDWTGAPGVLRSGYREHGLDVEQALVLDYGKSPQERAAASTLIIGVGGVLSLIGGVGSFLRLRRFSA